jgi:hypothetical protein
MASPNTDTSRQNWLQPLSFAVFFTAFYLYLWLFIKPQFIYHGFGIIILKYPAFSLDWSFLTESFTRPGGLVEYVSGFLSQCYYFPWIGALIVTLLAWMLCRCTHTLITCSGPGRLRILSCLPACALLITYNRYDHPLAMCLALLIALSSSIAYQRIRITSPAVSAVLFLIITAIIYHIAGAACLVFTALATLHEFFHRRHPLWAGLMLLMAISSVCLIAVFAFDLTLTQAYTILTPFNHTLTADMDIVSRIAVQCLYLFAPMLVLLIALWQKLFGRQSSGTVKPARRKRKTKKKNAASDNRNRHMLKFAAQAVFLAAVFTSSVFFSMDRMNREWMYMNYFAQRNMWADLLLRARKMPPGAYNVNSTHNINRALYHTGKLGNEMFEFTQKAEALMFTTPGTTSGMKKWKMCDLFFHLGCLNLAEHLAFEIMEIQGDLPFILRRLAQINIVKGQPETAKVFLNALGKNLVYARHAKVMLADLDKDPQLNNNPQLKYIRSIVSDKDSPTWKSGPMDRLLLGLLKHNPKNKMAFEYLMAYYLLTGQTDKIADNLARFDDFGYEQIPLHYQQAILIHIGSTGRNVSLHDRSISPQTINDYEKFLAACKNLQHNHQAAFNSLIADFGNSYFFYALFSAPASVN